MWLSIANSILLLSLIWCHVECDVVTTVVESQPERSTPKTCGADNHDQNCTVGSSDDTNNSSSAGLTYNPTCKFYLALSSIPNAGFGIYTVEDIPAAAHLTEAPDAPTIVVTDVDTHNTGEDGTLCNHDDYYWDGTSSGEFEAMSVSESVMTFGSLCNYHTYLHNIKPDDSLYNDSMTSRASGSPGVGAYSYYSGYLFKATRDVRAGEELFANYSEEWLDGRGSDFNKVPRMDDFETAGKIILTAINGLKEPDEMNDSILTTLKRVVKHLDKRTSAILPETVKGLENIVEGIEVIDREKNDEISEEASKKIARRLAEGTLLPRTLDWIKREGICMDNLVPQISTLPHAGRGAFAQRFLAKGEIVVPAPLLQIMDYSSLLMYDVDVNEDGELYKVSEDDDDDDNDNEDGPLPSGYQLIYNYCFSHEDTSMMLCPQSNSILLNHCSTRKSYGGDCERYNNHEDPDQRGPNAEIRWATGGWDPDTVDWLDMSVKKIEHNVRKGKRGLSMEIVTTRDIQPGEEVFIDYGKGWEDEWEEHVQNFQPYPSEDYVPVEEMNQMEKLRDPEELMSDPYPKNVRTVCIYFPEAGEILEEDGMEEYESEDPERIWIDDGSNYTESNPDYQEYGWLWECRVLKRDDEEKNTYVVELLTKKGTHAAWSLDGKSRHLTNYPRKSISFVSKMYQSDQYLLGVFRSYIRIPDEMLPEQWRDMEEDDGDED